MSFAVAKVWWSAGVVGSWGLAAERLANEEAKPVDIISTASVLIKSSSKSTYELYYRK